MGQLLGEDGVLVLPAAPGPAPLLESTPAELDAWRSKLLPLTCIAGLAGLPQVRRVRRRSGLPSSCAAQRGEGAPACGPCCPRRAARAAGGGRGGLCLGSKGDEPGAGRLGGWWVRRRCRCRLQVSIPAARVGGLPVGLGLIGPAGSDEALMRLAVRLAEAGVGSTH